MTIALCGIIIKLDGGDNVYVRLKELRDSLGLTQAEFGKSIGIAKSTYNNYETGIRDPKSDFWIAVAEKYGVTIDYLMGFSNDPHPAGMNKKFSDTAEAIPENELEREVIRLAGNLSDEQKDFFLALLRLTAARNQGLPAADLVSAGEAALKAERHNSTQ